MKTFIYVATVPLWTGYVTGATLLVVFVGHPEPGAVVLLSIGLVIFVTGSVLVSASVLSNLADPATKAGRRHYRVLWIIFAVAIALAIGLIIAFGVMSGVPAWIPAVIIVAGLACCAVTIGAAEIHRRRSVARDVGEWMPVPTSFRRRTLTRMAVTFAIAAALTAVLLAAFLRDVIAPLEIVAFTIVFAALAAAFVTLPSTLSFQSSVNQIFGTDIESRKRVTRLVVRGKSEELTETQQVMASRFASQLRELMPFQAAQLGLMFLSNVLIQASLWRDGGLGPVFGILFVAVGVLFLAALVFQRTQYRRVNRYAKEHPQETGNAGGRRPGHPPASVDGPTG